MLDSGKATGIKSSSIKIMMIVSYVLISLISILCVAFLTYTKTSNSVTNKVGKLTTAISDQVRLGINHQIKSVEDICSLVFAHEQIYQYRDTDENISDYDKIQVKSEIESVLLENSLMTNFGDFCIVYSNNKSVGKLSSTTSGLFGSDNIYSKAESFIARESTGDGWETGVDDYYTRLYYVKRVNEDAILLASIYTADLDALMETSDEMQGMMINIVNEENKIIFSTAGTEGGTALEESLVVQMKDKVHHAFIHEDKLVTMNTLNDNWKIVSDIPTSIVLKEVHEIRDFTILIAAIFVVIAVLVGVLFAQSITKPIYRLVGMMKKAEKGDLTVRTDFQTFGELKVLANSFDGMMDEIRHVLSDTERVVKKVTDEAVQISEIAVQSQVVSENISTAIEGIAQGSVEQFEHSQITFDSLETLADNIASTIDCVREAGESSEHTREIGSESIIQIEQLQEKATASNQALGKMQDTFDVLVNEVNNIETVLSLILNVSEETSLLALNASIEAARAGEAGRGFSVVADQVSKLAQQTEESTYEITQVITKMKEYVASTLEILNASKVVFEEQSEMIGETIISFKNIVASTTVISEKIENVQNITKTMNTLKEESIASTRNILEVAEHSSANTQEVSSVTVQELEVSKILADKAKQLEEEVDSLRKSLDRFIIE